MKKSIFVRPIINKSNGQCVINIPKKKMPKEMKDNLFNMTNLKIALEGWD